MHINDVYALRSALQDYLAEGTMDRNIARALLEAAVDEVQDFERHLEELALREEAAQC